MQNGVALEIPTSANGGVSSDTTTVTLELRPGLMWSDRIDFTSDDVALTYELSNTAPTTPDKSKGVKAITAKDKQTVVVTYSAPNPTFYQWGVGALSLVFQRVQGGGMQQVPRERSFRRVRSITPGTCKSSRASLKAIAEQSTKGNCATSRTRSTPLLQRP